MTQLKDFKTTKYVSRKTGIKYKTLLQRIKRGTVAYEELGNMKLIPTAEYERLMQEAGKKC